MIVSRPGKAKAKKGKILRVKQGYNPNSSSMGSIVFVLPAFLLGITAIFGALSGMFASLFLRKAGKPGTGIEKLYFKMKHSLINKKIKVSDK